MNLLRPAVPESSPRPTKQHKLTKGRWHDLTPTSYLQLRSRGGMMPLMDRREEDRRKGPTRQFDRRSLPSESGANTHSGIERRKSDGTNTYSGIERRQRDRRDGQDRRQAAAQRQHDATRQNYLATMVVVGALLALGVIALIRMNSTLGNHLALFFKRLLPLM